MKNSKSQNIILLFFSIFITLALCVSALHIFYPCLLAKIFLRPAYLSRVFKPKPDIMPGIYGDSHFLINSCGIRGDDLSSKYKKRILVVGGSAAECCYLDKTEAWPFLLQKNLDEKLERDDVWVGNVEISGKNADDHIKLLRNFPLKRLKIDLNVVLVGVNDLHKRSSLGDEYIASHLNNQEKDLPFYKKIFIWRLASEIQRKVLRASQWQVQDDAGEAYEKWRANRRSAKKIIDTLPDLSSALKEYRSDINMLIDIVGEKNISIIFMTQPTMWRADISSRDKDLLCSGGIGDFQDKAGCDYYSVEALTEGMVMYNNALLAVCKERGIGCLALASLLPKDTSIFLMTVISMRMGLNRFLIF